MTEKRKTSYGHGPQYMKPRFRFEYAQGGNNDQYRDNWDRIFSKKPVGKPDPNQLELPLDELGAVFIGPDSILHAERCPDQRCPCNNAIPFPEGQTHHGPPDTKES